MSVIESRLASLVHDSARDDPIERLRHEGFIITRMFAGVLALCCLPPYLLLDSRASKPRRKPAASGPLSVTRCGD